MERCGAKRRGRQELSNSNPSTASKKPKRAPKPPGDIAVAPASSRPSPDAFAAAPNVPPLLALAGPSRPFVPSFHPRLLACLLA
mmetsp:Transcript_12931/g.23152  ORF Transcript_12931/g.23152 Transcript_12931/m.23152 type:complete len:84 (-) Transcript_12931:232-483(-)